jgi:hypothetical protein
MRGQSTLLQDLTLIELPASTAENGMLVAIEGNKQIPFRIERIFHIQAPEGSIRGQHAHIRCTQFLLCTSGLVNVSCTDGLSKCTYSLDRPNLGLLVPPGIWCQQSYDKQASVLSVICDSPYTADDYIRSYDIFLSFKSIRKSAT